MCFLPVAVLIQKTEDDEKAILKFCIFLIILNSSSLLTYLLPFSSLIQAAVRDEYLYNDQLTEQVGDTET